MLFRSNRCMLPGGDDSPVSVVEYFQNKSSSQVDWNDRIALQSMWTLKEKGWKVAVKWKETPCGVGVFADEDIDRLQQCNLENYQLDRRKLQRTSFP